MQAAPFRKLLVGPLGLSGEDCTLAVVAVAPKAKASFLRLCLTSQYQMRQQVDMPGLHISRCW